MMRGVRPRFVFALTCAPASDKELDHIRAPASVSCRTQRSFPIPIAVIDFGPVLQKQSSCPEITVPSSCHQRRCTVVRSQLYVRTLLYEELGKI
jgi:hypothetical protein